MSEQRLEAGAGTVVETEAGAVDAAGFRAGAAHVVVPRAEDLHATAARAGAAHAVVPRAEDLHATVARAGDTRGVAHVVVFRVAGTQEAEPAADRSTARSAA